jgi:hypothetical protein
MKNRCNVTCHGDGPYRRDRWPQRCLSSHRRPGVRSLGTVKPKHQGIGAASVVARTLLALLGGMLFAIVGVSSASADTAHGSSGSFTLRGDVSGILKVPAYLPGGATGCTITVNIGAIKSWSEDFNFYGSKLTIDGKSKQVHFIDMEVGVRKLGQSYTLQPATNSLNNIYLMIGNEDFSWNSDSGTITTSKGGHSGSISGTLTAGTYQPGPTTIKGSWTGCEVLYVN